MLTGLLVAVVVLALACALNLALVLRLARIVRERPAAPTPGASLPEIGAALPAFTARTDGGRAVSSEDLATGTALVAFLSATCGPCHESLPQLRETALALRETGAHAVAVVSAPVAAGADDMVRALGDGCETIMAEGYSDARFAPFGVSAYPTFLLYEQGRLVAATHMLGDLRLPVPA
ncbi:hypothetical protein Skr01_15370 [Sphaerisporangium krabiense]|uniref:Thiol-disulfide isomerase/thioredoxin n=1 Tax=Sphaerisporangium krabiense TaxID=763782 RepID=A0A7W9DNT8_9ACTN|nr:redoxin family protein [Sphaerisporangium krabiense]MBB5624595.1 thiol-disulfide isomerase/thioredoxin [Sphaerisporangium krabiense]GII61452.1 hypothetical protein Skr01_15370 [Sphaerisporangium krabiense]